jgi:hypothetical protein
MSGPKQAEMRCFGEASMMRNIVVLDFDFFFPDSELKISTPICLRIEIVYCLDQCIRKQAVSYLDSAFGYSSCGMIGENSMSRGIRTNSTLDASHSWLYATRARTSMSQSATFLCSHLRHQLIRHSAGYYHEPRMTWFRQVSTSNRRTSVFFEHKSKY